MTTLRERCLAINLLVLDVDGALTAGGIVHGTGGFELKTFHVRDGSAVKAWRQAGKKAAIITGRSSPVVDVRAAEIGIATVVQGAGDKLAAFRRVLQELGTAAGQACY